MTVDVYQNITQVMIVMTVQELQMEQTGQVTVDVLQLITQVMIVMTVTAYQMVIAG